MARPNRQTWTPATEFKITKLKPNGPKPGQSVDAFIYGKDKGYQELIDNPRTKLRDVA